MLEYLQHKYALSHKGAADMVKAVLACTLSYLVLMLPVGLLYALVCDLMHGTVSGQAGFYAAGILLCLLLIFLTTYVQYNATFFATYMESGVRRIAVAEKLRRLPLSFFGKKDLSDLTSVIMADCATLETASSHWIPELCGSFLSTFVIAVCLFAYDWRMAIAALWVLPMSFGIVVLSSSVMHRKQVKQMAVKMTCADGIQECLECVRDLKANNAEQDYLAGLDEKIRAVEKQTIATEIGNAVFNGSARLVLKFGIATTALAGGMLLKAGGLDVLTFFMFLLVVSRMYDPLITSLDNLSAILSANVQCARMDEILSSPVQTGTEKLTNQGYDIVFDHVGFSYNREETVLKEVSFTARQGEITALIGPSGGGKTTVSRLAARFWDITKGKITVGGMDISTVDPETLMSLYAIVFQDVILFNNSVLENVRVGKKDASDEAVLAAARMANCDEFAERLPNGWQTQIGENGCVLSGGERQRISIARAFLKNAPIILLDEATASLDVENETQIQNALSKLIRGKTVLLIAHRMRTVSGADKIAVLEDGTVRACGTPEQVYEQSETYRSMVDSQGKAEVKKQVS